MEKPFIRLGDKTSHGGTVIEADMTFVVFDKPVALVGHKVVCPKCKGTFPIVGGTPDMASMGMAVARHGDKTSCGATLLASQQLTTWSDKTDHGAGLPQTAAASLTQVPVAAVADSDLCLECLMKAASARQFDGGDGVRFEHYRQALARVSATNEFCKLYALCDGLQAQEAGMAPFDSSANLSGLFQGTPHAALAAAGPWLIDVSRQVELAEALAEMENTQPLVSWLITPVPFDGLADLLRLKMTAKLPDGSEALLRFHDPRVLRRLAQTLDGAQRTAFFEYRRVALHVEQPAIAHRAGLRSLN